MSTEAVIGAAVLLASYLIGSVPFGFLLAKWRKGVDVTEAGSGNIGATNVARLAGRGLGAATLVLDASKGLLPVIVMRYLVVPWVLLSGTDGWGGEGSRAEEIWIASAGALAFLGHCFPVWTRMRGGKGVATALGVLIGLAPWAALAGAVAYCLVFAAFRVSSAGSLVAAVVAALVAFVHGTVPGTTAVFMTIVVLMKHRENIRRLLERSEHRF